MKFCMSLKVMVALLAATPTSFAFTISKRDTVTLDAGGCTLAQRRQINTAITSASSVAAFIDGNHDQSDWDTYFAGSDVTAVLAAYGQLVKQLGTNSVNYITCPSSTTGCSNGVYAVADALGGKINLCQTWFSAIGAQGCLDPAAQGSAFQATNQDTIIVHEIMHLFQSSGKYITDGPDGEQDFTISQIENLVALSRQSPQAAAVAATQWVANAYVFFAWGNYVKKGC